MTEPRKRRVPWARRIISTLILLALLIGLVWGAIKIGTLAVNWLSGVFRGAHETSQQSSAPQPVVIEPCQSDDLNVTLTPSATTVALGAGFQMDMTIESTVSDGCSLMASDASVELLAGVDPIWSPVACQGNLADLQLLLAPGEPWSRSFTWDGSVNSGCEPQTAEDTGAVVPAPAGTYELTLQLPGGVREPVIQIVVE